MEEEELINKLETLIGQIDAISSEAKSLVRSYRMKQVLKNARPIDPPKSKFLIDLEKKWAKEEKEKEGAVTVKN